MYWTAVGGQRETERESEGWRAREAERRRGGETTSEADGSEREKVKEEKLR